MDDLQAFLHSHLPLPAPTRLVRATHGMNGTQENLEDPLSSDLDLSFTSAMSLSSPSSGRAKLVEDVGKDVIPMDISPEPSRFLHQSRITGGNSLDKVTRSRAFTSSARLFGRDLSNEFPPILATASSCEQRTAATNRTQHLPPPLQWAHRIECTQLQKTDSLPAVVCLA
jgi:M-phase inducer tyrosine phosphatase